MSKSDAPNQKFVDLSHTIEDGMITHKGLPAPIICDYLSREQSRSHYACNYLVESGAVLVGLDSLNIDDTIADTKNFITGE